MTDKRFRKGSFTEMIYNKMKGKGWFEVKDIIDIYSDFREVSKQSWQYIFMSGDASWRLKLMCDTGVLKRKANEKYKEHYLYKVIS